MVSSTIDKSRLLNQDSKFGALVKEFKALVDECVSAVLNQYTVTQAESRSSDQNNLTPLPTQLVAAGEAFRAANLLGLCESIVQCRASNQNNITLPVKQLAAVVESYKSVIDLCASLTDLNERTVVQLKSRLSDEELAPFVEIYRAAIDLLKHLDALSHVAGDASDRSKAQAALDFVTTFITRLSKRDGLQTPLLKLSSALYDVDRGVVVPMLQAEQRTNSDPCGRTMLKGVAAATMSLLMKTGVPRIDAARQVANQLYRGGMTFGDRRTSEPWRSVAAWRDQAIKAIKSKSVDNVLAEAYEGWLTEVIVPPPVDQQEYEPFRRSILKTLLRTTRFDDAQ
jgi:hypothetical protein